MRPRLLPLPFLAFFIAASMETVRAEESSKKPNVIVIFTDDHGWPDLGVSGIYRDLRTPHLDQLAKDGVYATNGYASAPQCVPSRAGILTGKYQNRFGVESNGVALTGFNAEKTVAERLKLAGYATGQIGKWHLGPASKIVDHGFDDVYSKNSNRPCHANFTLDGKTISMQVVKDGLYHLDACSQAARAFIQRHQKESFFLYLAYRAPHVPLDAPKKYLDRFPGKMPERRRQALAMISAMDDGVGLIRSTLKQCGLTDDTLIFVIGDNGAPLKIHKHDAPGGGPGWDGSLNRPMNGEKGMLSEGGIRVPYVVAWPGTFPAGQIYQHPVISLDVAATALAIAGGEGDSKLDGVNLLPFLSGKRKDPPHASLYWRWIAQSAVREGKWKFLKGGTREYLFDLAKDQGEKVNLAATHADVANRLRSKLRTWAADLKPAGLTTRKMSSVWEQYFDFYLDGKPAPPLRKKSRRGPKAERVKGWVARNAKLSSRGKALRVTTNAKQRNPFLAVAGLSEEGPLRARIRLSSEAGGQVGIAWRAKGQSDFSKDQVVTKKVGTKGDWTTVELEVSEARSIIHIRVHLPKGRTDVRSIELLSKDGSPRRSWDFATP